MSAASFLGWSRQLFAQVKPNRFALDTTKIMTGALLSQVIPFIATPVLARMYLPETFGYLAILLVFVSVFSVIACGRFESALMLLDSEKDLRPLLQLCLVICIGVSIVAFAVVGISLLLKVEGVAVSFLLWVPICVLCLGFSNAMAFLFLRSQKFWWQSLLKVIGSAVTAFLPMILYMALPANDTYLLVGAVLGFLVVFLVSIAFWGLSNFFDLFRVDFEGMKRLAIRYQRFPLFEAWGALLNSISAQMPVFILSAYFGANATGQFSMARSIVTAPAMVLGYSVSQIYFERASSKKRLKQNIYPLTRNLTLGLAVLGIAPVVTLLFGAPFLFGLFLGEKWFEAAGMAQQLAIPAYFIFVFYPLSSIFAITEKQVLSLTVNAILFIVPSISLVIASRYFGSVSGALTAFTLSQALVYVGLVYVVLRSARYAQFAIAQ